ncbi:hypothetical protein [Paenirhodobacter populi]|uniref:Head decoration protein n=1 Tax=Paenirhodobacter populi TaxID=2306993 RepID=A0A443J053_9RHOB|nr:hypothetical protein [Sinirhodobacter populi]RWR13834.1 hypothetical protein D2T33_05395 [Sinirhodobacter populi]
MANYTPGIASVILGDTEFNEPLFLNYDIRPAAYEVLPLAAGETIDLQAPVALDENNAVVNAEPGTPSIGLCMTPINGTTTSVSVLRTGVLNEKAIAWQASYDTAAKRAAAFRGAPSPTNIMVKVAV